MWFPVTLLLLAGVAVAHHDQSHTPHQHAWEPENEYQYLVRSRTVAGLDKLKEQYTGVQLKGILTIQVKSPESLLARFTNPQYAHIHKSMNGPESEISDQQLEYRQIPMSGKSFEVKLKHGVIRDLLVDQSVPTWELNILKGVMSQLQIDTQGENAMESQSTQIPINENSSVMFKAMEDSVGGKCEVLYDISPMSSDSSDREKLDKVPFPQYGNGQHYDVKKVKNYEKCQQRQVYHHGISEPWKKKHNEQDEIVSQLSVSQMIISGNLKHFTIQSTVTKNQISVKPKQSEPVGAVHTITRLTLIKKGKSSNDMVGSQELNNLESTGNLVYTYNNPFSNSENRRERRPSVSRNSAQVQSSESSSSQNSHRGSSSSSSSSSEENEISNLQSKAAMHLAPNVPLLPYFIGYKGKSIQMSDKIDVVDLTLDLISQIAKEVESPVNPRVTLDKYLKLKDLLRVMNYEQYTEIENRLPKKSSSLLANVMLSVYRDAVTQAGTGPALLTIGGWLKNRKVEGLEAARILSQIPKIVLQPTEEYVKTFYELIVDPRITQQKYANVSAPLALAELVYNSRENQQFYPTRSFGPMTMKDNKDVVEHYIPYLANQLKQGYSENNNQKIQTYIVALGLTGHPEIIPVFEPYLEGTKPATKYQRFLIVTFLSTLARSQPKLVGPIFFKLYLDNREENDIRALAVHQLIQTNPPLLTWQRLAKYTFYEKSEQVNSVIKTTINSLAAAKQPSMKLYHLAQKARSVRYLLNPAINTTSSVGYYKDIESWLFKELTLQTVANNIPVPKFINLGLYSSIDYLEQPIFESEFAVSSVQQLVNKFNRLNWDDWDNEKVDEESMQKSLVEKLTQELKIKSGQQNKVEGNFFLNTPYGSVLSPFDSHTIQTIPSVLRKLLKNDHKLELITFNNYERTVSFPTESGLPFSYTVQTPTVVKYEKEWKKEQSSEKRFGVANILLANVIEKRFGFVTPFDHQNYITGIDDSQMLQIPVEFEVELNRNQQNLEFKIRPNLPQTQTDSQLTLLHCSTIPFTARQNILDLQPVSVDRNTHHIMTSKKQKTALERGIFSINLECDKEEAQENSGDNVPMFWKLQLNNNRYKKLDVIMNTERAAKNEFSMNIVYDSKQVDANEDSNKSDMQIFPIEDSKPNSKDRRNQIMNGLSKGLQSGKVHVIDMFYNSPTSQAQQVASIGLVKSNVDHTAKGYIYWNSLSPRNGEKQNEFCYIQKLQYTPSTPLDFEYMVNNAPQDNFKAEWLYGKSCKNGEKVVVLASAMRSNQMQEVIENSELTKQCREDIQKEHKTTQACQRAIELTEIRDQYEISSINTNQFVQKIIQNFIELVAHYLSDINVQVLNPENSQMNAVTVKVNKLPLHGMPKVQLFTPQMNVSFPSLPETMEAQELMAEVDSMLQNEEQSASCTLDKELIYTFDNRVYRVQLGHTKHVLMTTYKQQDPDNHKYYMSIPSQLGVSILAQDAQDNSRIVTMLLANREIKLMKLNNLLKVFIDGQLMKGQNYVHRHHGEVVFEIVALPDGSVQVISDKYGIGAVYDGERIKISVSDTYRNAVRGLCGNYDANPDTDFLTPKNCLLSRPEEFAATYALIDENSQGPAVENKQKAEQAQCRELQSGQQYQRNIISDREAGRRLTEDKNWGYHQDNIKRENGQNRGQKQSQEDRLGDYQKHNIVYRTRVVEEGDEICFTTRPVQMCREGTRPTERKPRMYKLYCQPRNEESLAMKRRVEQGANPDFTRKPVSKSHVFQVPSVCSAA